jgi:hypothetical protein
VPRPNTYYPEPASRDRRRLAVLRGGPDDDIFRENFGPFVRTLQANGFAEGTNLTLDYRIRPGGVDPASCAVNVPPKSRWPGRRASR